MDRIHDIWDWAKRISGVFSTVCFCLYFIRCIVSGHVLTVIQFELYLNKLGKAIFA